MLCELAHSFPPRIADLLERDRELKRNFREETVTDLLMASLIGLEPLGIRVDFPDEPTTGGDMDWIFAAPLEINGGRYLTVRLQAKRAQIAKRKNGDFWFYQHLDHDKGKQAQTLMKQAGGGGNGTLPLYIMYHPKTALASATAKLPAIEGVNLVFAHHIAPVVAGGCKLKTKKVAYWRDKFLPLSTILCWPAVVTGPPDLNSTSTTTFSVDGVGARLPELTGGFHPDIVAQRLNTLNSMGSGSAEGRSAFVEPVNDLPQSVARSIRGELTTQDRRNLERPRVILSTTIRRSDAEFARVSELI